MSDVEDIDFESAVDVTSIAHRLHPIDVGFSLRGEPIAVRLPAEPTLRVSYQARDGSRRVMTGPRLAVVERLVALGYDIIRDADDEDDELEEEEEHDNTPYVVGDGDGDDDYQNDDRLVTIVPQVDGGLRYLYAQDAEHARIARELLRDDPAWVDAMDRVEGIAITWSDGPRRNRGEADDD